MTSTTLTDISQKTAPIFEKYGLLYAGVFGSTARGEAREDSDIDILFKTGKPLSLFDIFDLKDELGTVLQKKVDLVSENAVVSYFKEYIYKDLKPLYGKR